jgi:hypothetical protein
MAYEPTGKASSPADPEPGEGQQLHDYNEGSLSSQDGTGGELPRLVKQRQVVGPYGEDEIQATDNQGRRWYHLRPQLRGRYDLIGFNYIWWLIWILFLVLIFFPWGYGWGY